MRREHLERLRPLTVGWHSVPQADFSRIELRWRDSAARFEGGSQNMVGFLGLAASIELLLGFGVHNLARRILETTDEVCEKLTHMGAAVLSQHDQLFRLLKDINVGAEEVRTARLFLAATVLASTMPIALRHRALSHRELLDI